MQVDIKPIPDDDFITLVELYICMGKTLTVSLPSVVSTKILSNDIQSKPNFHALGLYEDEQLTGFVTGYALTSNIVYFSGIYVENKNKNAKSLIEEGFKYFKALGFDHWEADLNNDTIFSILDKYNIIPLYTKVRSSTWER